MPAITSFTVSTEVKSDLFHAWEYYFNQINRWWPKEHFTSSKTKRFIIDTFIGGKAYEDYGEGGGLIWGEIIGVDYPYSLQIKGNLTREFGGPATSYERFTFQSTKEGTEVIYSVDFIGDINSRSSAKLKEGWKELLQQHFKNYCSQRG